MKLRYPHAARWLLCACTALMLVACGGGSSEAQEEPRDDSSDAVIPAPPAADPRNGSYTMVASDGYEYTLTLDFDAKTYKVAGNGIDEDGDIEADGSEFEFKPGNAVGSTGFNTTRFSYVDNTVVGAYALRSGAMPFVAARSFMTNLPSTTLTFNLLNRKVDPTYMYLAVGIRQAQITTDGKIRICRDAILHEVTSCPEGSLFEAPLSMSGSQFSYPESDTLTVTFRLANVGADKVYLGASAAEGSPTARQFTIGTPALPNFPIGSFTGAATGAEWATLSIQEENFSLGLTSFTGTWRYDSGTIGTLAQLGTTLGSVAETESENFGPLVGVRSTSLTAFITAPWNSVSALGGLFIGAVR